MAAAAKVDVAIALGSNLGHRLQSLRRAIEEMEKLGIQVVRKAQLYESAPMYVERQPFFLNSAIKARTSLGPHDLLRALKDIEVKLGRLPSQRYGPRAVDLDIILYGRKSVHDEDLQIPHPRLYERPFVLLPLRDLHMPLDCSAQATHASGSIDSILSVVKDHVDKFSRGSTEELGLSQVIPVGHTVDGDVKLWKWTRRKSIMGVLNVTPDSFSDGGQHNTVERAINKAQSLVEDGADIIDIGGQSTRPDAERVTSAEEAGRVLPVIEALTSDAKTAGAIISVDTFDSTVAAMAIQAGAGMVNDVSSGQLDSEMTAVVGNSPDVCYVMMHMRGMPQTMQSEENTRYESLVEDVSLELNSRMSEAIERGIDAWRLAADPGIGFAKTWHDNWRLLRGLDGFKRGLTSVCSSRIPMVVGASRKSFIGKTLASSQLGSPNRRHKDSTSSRDVASASLHAILAYNDNGDVFRAHCASMTRDAMTVAAALSAAADESQAASLDSHELRTEIAGKLDP